MAEFDYNLNIKIQCFQNFVFLLQKEHNKKVKKLIDKKLMLIYNEILWILNLDELRGSESYNR